MAKRTKYTKEYLAPFVADATNWSDLLRKLGLRKSGGMHRHIQGCVRAAKLDVSHFTGQGWNRGGVGKCYTKKTDSEVFIEDSTYNPSHLYVRLLKWGWIPVCAICGQDDVWQGKPLRLHVDHINGVHSDHRLENLRFLCPNCHAQTKTYANRGGVVEHRNTHRP